MNKTETAASNAAAKNGESIRLQRINLHTGKTVGTVITIARKAVA